MAAEAKPLAVSLAGKSVEVTLGEPIANGSDDAAKATTGALAERLARAGLKPQEVELFVSQTKPLVFEGEAVVVACRLDASGIDEKLPLSIFPAPARTVRVALVVMRNADPQLGGEVDRLVSELGDARFATRETAQARLMELGALAFANLNRALNNTDPEVVIRAERILLSQNQTPNPQAAGAGGGGGGAGVGGAGGAGAVGVAQPPAAVPVLRRVVVPAK